MLYVTTQRGKKFRMGTTVLKGPNQVANTVTYIC